MSPRNSVTISIPYLLLVNSVRLTRPLIFLLLFGCDASSQAPAERYPDPSASTAEPCGQGLMQATQDFQKGAYTLHSRELVPPPSTYLHVLDETYHIRWRFVETTTPGSYYGCYDSLMRQQLQGKYGANFLQQAAGHADSLQQTGTWYRDASFPGGIDQVQQFVWQHVQWAHLAEREGRIFASFTVDTTGRLQEVKILKGVDPSHDQEVLRVLEQMPRWTPAYGAGHAVPQSYTVPIPFSPVIRRQYAR